MYIRKSRRTRTRGVALAVVGLAMIAIVPMIGLGIDGACLYMVRARLSQAADAAALAGARALNGADDTAWIASATAAATKYFYANFPAGYWGSTNVAPVVTVKKGNPSKPWSVTVSATADTPVYFMRMLNKMSARVQVPATAWRADMGCIFVLDPSADNAMSLGGAASFQSECGVNVNSSSSSALSISGASRLTAPSVKIVGNYQVGGASSVAPPPTTGAAPVADPLGYLSAPPVGLCTNTNYSLGSTSTDTISPGVYCNGISVGNSSNLTLGPGIYILLGGGLSVGGASRISGSGVMLYNTQGPGYAYQPVSISGSATVQLSAPTTGPYAGILVFQDRSVVAGGASSLGGAASMSLTGTLYLPTTGLTLGGASGGAYTIIVSKTLSLSGASHINDDYSSLPNGSPVAGTVALSR